MDKCLQEIFDMIVAKEGNTKLTNAIVDKTWRMSLLKIILLYTKFTV